CFWPCISSTMAITTKLELRQSHSLVMTPQLQQAIKLLQLSNMELATFVDAELERNPLLEREDPDEPNGAVNGEAVELAASPFKDGDRTEDGEGSATNAAQEAPESDAPDDGEWRDLQSDAGVGQGDDLDTEREGSSSESENSFGAAALKDSS